MKIMIVTRNMCAGGAERVISQLLKEWEKNCNLHCTLVLLDKVDDFYEIPKSIDVLRVGQLHNNRIINKFKSYIEVRNIVKKSNPDIVLSLPEEIGIYIIGALLGLNRIVVVSERNDPNVMPYKKITRLLRKLLYPFASGFIFQTKQAQEFFPKKIQNKSIILPNPLDLSRLPNLYCGDYKKEVVAAGRFEKQKNFKLLVDAFSIFMKTHQEYRLIIYGDGSLRKELSDYAETKLGKDKFLFPGRNNNLLNDMQKSEVFVLSSDYEGTPNVLIEAMATGMAAISTNYSPGGVESIIDNYKNGIIVNKGDVYQLAEAITYIVDNPNEAHKFRSEATKIREIFDAKSVSSEWLNFLMDLHAGVER